MKSRSPTRSAALKFVLLVGVMSFFADFTYEASLSIIGPYLAVLGAGALAVGVITGFGELLCTGCGWYPGVEGASLTVDRFGSKAGCPRECPLPSRRTLIR